MTLNSKLKGKKEKKRKKQTKNPHHVREGNHEKKKKKGKVLPFLLSGWVVFETVQLEFTV